MYLQDPKGRAEIVAVISLMDLSGPTVYPEVKTSALERYEWAKEEMERQVSHPQFRQFFAVHETEAWLLSSPAIFPMEVRKGISARRPERVNFDEPPAKLLDRLYRRELKRHYKKVTGGRELFDRLSPSVAYEKCNYLKLMLDEMLVLAKEAGL
jgi:hypothetical protein